MTLETKHGVFYFRAFSHLEVLPGCLKRPGVIREGFGDLPGFWQHLVKDLQSPESKEKDRQKDVYSRDAAGGREIDINFLLPFRELSSKPDGLWGRAEAQAEWHVSVNDGRVREGWKAIWVIWDPWELIREGSGGVRSWQAKWDFGHCSASVFGQMEIKTMFECKISLNNLKQFTGNGEEGRLKVLGPSFAAECCWVVNANPLPSLTKQRKLLKGTLVQFTLHVLSGRNEVWTHVCLTPKLSGITLLWKEGPELNTG